MSDQALTNFSDKAGSTETLLPAPVGPQVDPVAWAVMLMLAQNLEDLALEVNKGSASAGSNKDALSGRVQDQVSYIVSVGVVDKLSAYFHGVQDPIDSSPEVGEFLLSALEFISGMVIRAISFLKSTFVVLVSQKNQVSH